MNKGDAFHKIQKALSEIRQELSADSKNLREVKAEKPDYAIEGYARLLQLARAGLVPQEMLYKMTNILKDPKRFGVSPQIRNDLYDLMIKTLNYIVVTDPATWARFRQHLLNTEVVEKSIEEDNDMSKNVFSAFKKALHEEYKNLNDLDTSKEQNQHSHRKLLGSIRTIIAEEISQSR